MSTTKIQGAVFDMDGTLIDSLWLWEKIWDTIGDVCGIPGFRPTEKDDKAMRTITLENAMILVQERYGLPKSAKELLDLVNDLLRHFYTHEAQTKPGVHALLEHLQKNRVKMYIASASATDFIDLALDCCHLTEFFEGIVSCEDVGKNKEHPDVFLKAVELLGTDIQNTWLFEDSLVAVQTAKKIGLKTVGIYDKNNYSQKELQQTADIYIAAGESFEKLTLPAYNLC